MPLVVILAWLYLRSYLNVTAESMQFHVANVGAPDSQKDITKTLFVLCVFVFLRRTSSKVCVKPVFWVNEIFLTWLNFDGDAKLN